MRRRGVMLVAAWALSTPVVGAPLCGTAGTAAGTRTCLEALGAEADARLAAYLDAAQAEADQMTIPPVNLAHAQALWANYRQQQCGDVYLYWGTGSYRYEAVNWCHLELTRARTHALWSAYLVRGGGPPVLPEPGP